MQRDTKNNRYDLHPIVRHYAYARLSNKTSVHVRYPIILRNFPDLTRTRYRVLKTLRPLIELYYHIVCAGKYQEAAGVYYEQIWQMLYYRFGAYQTQIELLRAAVPPMGKRQPAAIKDRRSLKRGC